MSKLIVSLSPHAHGTDSVERNMYGVIIAMIPALLVSFAYFGIGSAVVCLSSVAACMFFEWSISKYILKKTPSLSDGSAIVTGLLLGFNLPSNLPIWIVLLGALVAIGIAKMSFGGIGNNPFNPALVGRCFLLVSFPAQMTSWPIIGQWDKYLDAATGATPLSIMKEAIKTGVCHRVTHRFGIHAVEEDYHMAHPHLHHCHGIRYQWTAAHCQSHLRRPFVRNSLRRAYVRCHLHGYGLCHFTHDS